MKLTPENIARIEAILTDHEDDYPATAIIIKYQISELHYLSELFAGLRAVGVKVPYGKKGRRLTKKDSADFVQWLLREKRARENAERGL